jgi:SAM-dependent methyltransferase
MIARCGARVTGIDPSPLGRTLAIKKFEEHGLSGRFVENMSQCEPEEFDIVVCSEVIEHVVDPKVLLNQIAEALKPGGVCVLTTPIRLTEHPIDQNHVKEYFPTELVTLLRSHFEQVSLQKLMPADSLLIYYWRPNFLLRFGILRYVFNLLDIMFSYNIVEGINTLERYHTLQLAVAVKGDNAPR